MFQLPDLSKFFSGFLDSFTSIPHPDDLDWEKEDVKIKDPPLKNKEDPLIVVKVSGNPTTKQLDEFKEIFQQCSVDKDFKVFTTTTFPFNPHWNWKIDAGDNSPTGIWLSDIRPIGFSLVDNPTDPNCRIKKKIEYSLPQEALIRVFVRKINSIIQDSFILALRQFNNNLTVSALESLLDSPIGTLFLSQLSSELLNYLKKYKKDYPHFEKIVEEIRIEGLLSASEDVLDWAFEMIQESFAKPEILKESLKTRFQEVILETESSASNDDDEINIDSEKKELSL